MASDHIGIIYIIRLCRQLICNLAVAEVSVILLFFFILLACSSIYYYLAGLGSVLNILSFYKIEIRITQNLFFRWLIGTKFFNCRASRCPNNNEGVFFFLLGFINSWLLFAFLRIADYLV